MIRTNLSTGMHAIPAHAGDPIEGRFNTIGDGNASRYITRECLKSLRRLIRSLKRQLSEHGKTHPKRYQIEDTLRQVRREYRSELSILNTLS